MTPEFRKIRKRDVYQFSNWGRHEDSRFYQYNFPFDEKEEFDDWYRMKQKWLFRKVYGLFLGEYPVAFVTLKHINWLKKSAELGIGVDPNHLNKGFGTELLNKYLEYVFNKFPINKMFLRVAVFNERAKKSYEKVGFKEVDRRVELFEEQSYKDIVLQDYPEQFQLIQGELCTEFIVMCIHKVDFTSKK